jgi:hypothetical protein
MEQKQKVKVLEFPCKQVHQLQGALSKILDVDSERLLVNEPETHACPSSKDNTWTY